VATPASEQHVSSRHPLLASGFRMSSHRATTGKWILTDGSSFVATCENPTPPSAFGHSLAQITLRWGPGAPRSPWRSGMPSNDAAKGVDMCGDCPKWRAWFCGTKGDCSVLKAQEDKKPCERRSYSYGRSWTFRDDPCRVSDRADASPQHEASVDAPLATARAQAKMLLEELHRSPRSWTETRRRPLIKGTSLSDAMQPRQRAYEPGPEGLRF
jgi:hypothetical protein